MDKRVSQALENRALIVRDIAFILGDRTLTKIEIIEQSKYHLDGNTFSRLVSAGVISCTRGKNAKYTLCKSFMFTLEHANEFAKSMHTESQISYIEKKREATVSDYKRQIKSLRNENELLKEEISILRKRLELQKK